ncbi:MAG: holo-ACP synthase [Candidatus Thorarchaeota archaeon]|nr:holo-ACP synthase [Candidatus Thorarchaeota archaeon]
MTNEASNGAREMNLNVGVDIINIDRFRGVKREAPFIKRTYTPKELDYCYGYSDPAPHLATTFAGKEAVVKSIGTKQCTSLGSIEILRNGDGAPYVHVNGIESDEITVSLSHSKNHAVAVAATVSSLSKSGKQYVQGILNSNALELLPTE